MVDNFTKFRKGKFNKKLKGKIIFSAFEQWLTSYLKQNIYT